MMRVGFFYRLRTCLVQKSAAQLAAERIRNVIARDRDALQSEVTKQLSAELADVFARYFTVHGFDCCITDDVSGNRIVYTLEAELVKST